MSATAPATMRLLGSRAVSGVVAVDDVAALVDHLRPAPARSEPVLVVVPSDQGPVARRTLSMARAAAPGAHAVVVETSLPPLARQHLVDTLTSLSPRLTSGELLIACELVEANVIAGALLHSVTRLSRPAPSMAQHVRSWLPSTRFVVQTHPTQHVSRLDHQDPDSYRPTEPRPGWQMRCSEVDPSDEAAMRLLAEQLTGAPAREAPAPAGSADRWKSAFCEFVAHPVGGAPGLQAALSTARPCRSCGAAVIWPACRVCGAQQDDDVPPTPTGAP